MVSPVMRWRVRLSPMAQKKPGGEVLAFSTAFDGNRMRPNQKERARCGGSPGVEDVFHFKATASISTRALLGRRET